jgi:hypothetical protein
VIGLNCECTALKLATLHGEINFAAPLIAGNNGKFSSERFFE